MNAVSASRSNGHLRRCFAIRMEIGFQPLRRSGADSRSLSNPHVRHSTLRLLRFLRPCIWLSWTGSQRLLTTLKFEIQPHALVAFVVPAQDPLQRPPVVDVERHAQTSR